MDAATQYGFHFVRGALPAGAKRLLEIGCGSGALAARLVAEGFEVVAIDSDEEAVAAARLRGVVARLAPWPDFTDGRFDSVMFTRSLHHVHDLRASVAAAFACLAPGGRVIVEDFDAAFADEATFGWFASLLRLLRAAGVAVDASEFLADLAAAERPAEAWHAEHDHHLHSAAEIENALAAAAGDVARSGSAYFFRYLAAGGEALAEMAQPVLEHELDLIGTGRISTLGRRFVAWA